MDGAHAGPLARQRPADVGQAGVVPGGTDLGAGVEHVTDLVGQHRHRRVSVLDREGAAEAAALGRGGQLDQVDAAHRAQQPQRRVADLEQPQRVTGGMVGHPVGVIRADVLHAEHVDQELRQLVDARGHRGDLGGEPLVAGQLGDPRVVVAHHRRARPRRCDHRLRAAEDPHEAARQGDGLALVAGVEVHLAAAGLLQREVDLVAEPLQQPHDRLPSRGEHGVVEARQEQGGTHVARVFPRRRAVVNRGGGVARGRLGAA